MEELVDVGRSDAHERLLLGDLPLVHHVDRDPHRGRRGPLPGSRLEEVELPFLDGELDVLHVAIVFLQDLADLEELLVDLRHLLLQRGDRLRGADPGDDVLPLGVQQVLTVELVLTGRRVAGERDPGAGVLAHVSEHHRLHVHRGSDQAVDVVDLAVLDRPRVVPRAEHRPDRPPQLLVRVLGELHPELVLDHLLERLGELLQVVGGEIGVELNPALLLQSVDDLLERIELLLGLGLQAEDDVPVHLHEPPVGVVGEPGVPGLARESLHRLVGQAEVEDRVHHPGHGDRCSGADRDEERVVRIPEPHPGLGFELAHVLFDLFLQSGRVLTRMLLGVIAADLSRDGEPGRDRDSDPGHLREVRPFSPEEVLHRGVPLALALAEEIHVLFHLTAPP